MTSTRFDWEGSSGPPGGPSLNLSGARLSLGFGMGTDLGNLPGPSPSFRRWRDSSARGLFQGHRAGGQSGAARPFPGLTLWSQGGICTPQALLLRRPREPGYTSDYRF